MFIYLSKKIAIPNNTPLRCISWSKNHGYIACGGDDGLLKVLRLEAAKDGVRGLAAPTNLSMNQTLEGHSGQIQVVTWNEQHQKLTSSDQNGLIIVWMLYKGTWYEEMINNRNKSVVTGMSWSSDGQKICIVYEDGAVIVGGVDGNRIWSKELRSQELSAVEWSPDSCTLLFGLRNGEVHLYDNVGSFLSKLNATSSPVITSSYSISRNEVVAIDWYNGKFGYAQIGCPSLAVCHANGKLQLMINDSDDSPIIIETEMRMVSCKWNHDGSIIALVGTMVLSDVGDKEANVVQFYTPVGEHLRSLRVPGTLISSCAWEGGSLRIALGVDSFIYFANVRPSYRWCYFGETVLYSFNQPGRTETGLCFWNTRSNERQIRYVGQLLAVASGGDYSCISVRSEDTPESFSLILYNSIGTIVDVRTILMEPLWLTMSTSVVVAASKNYFYVWPYSGSTLHLVIGAGDIKKGKWEKSYFIDDTPSGIPDVMTDNAEGSQFLKPTSDPICCLTASSSTLIVGRESGEIHQYTLPNCLLISKHSLPTRPHKLILNCLSDRLAIIDVTGLLTLFDLEEPPEQQVVLMDSGSSAVGGRLAGTRKAGLLKFERKDVWDLCWANDNSMMFAIMEKTRMYIFRGTDSEDPVLCSGYLCSFQDLEVKTALLDEAMKEPLEPSKDWIVVLEAKSLRDLQDLLNKADTNENLQQAVAFTEERTHPRLWRLISERALQRKNFEIAESAVVRCKDLAMIRRLRRIKDMRGEKVKETQAYALAGDYDQAQTLLIAADRRDLVVNLRRTLGDCFEVLKLLQSGVGANDLELKAAYNEIGEYYADRHEWELAKPYYEKAENNERLIVCYYNLEDYDGLERILNLLPSNDRLLPELGQMFSSVGLCDQAVQSYLKCGQHRSAVDCCVKLQQWHQAVTLARQMPDSQMQTPELLRRYAKHLLEEGHLLRAAQLYRNAGNSADAARLLIQVAEQDGKNKGPLLRRKKLFVLAAMLIEEHRLNQMKKRQETGSSASYRETSGVTVSSALIGLLDEINITPTDINNRLFDEAWRGAEAIHFFMLVQRQLYEGSIDAAMKTALILPDYEDVLEPEQIYSLLALSSAANKAFGTCSRAFIRLESLENSTEAERERFQELSLEIFTKYSPKDTKGNRVECKTCETLIPDWCGTCPSCNNKFPRCVVTGRPITDLRLAWSCSTCKHRALEQEIALRRVCPLCHSAIGHS